MPEDDKRKFEIPWTTLLPVIAALAGVVAQFRPLVSTRPSAPAEKSIPAMAEQDVDARLWQDPIAVAEKQRSALMADIAANRIPRARAEKHDLSNLVALLHSEARTIGGKILLLGVMIDAGPYSEQAEARLRARQAVLEGLSESGFIPTDGEHIGYATTRWPISTDNGPDVVDAGEDRSLLIPWEQCEAMDDPARVSPPGTARVVVLWLAAGNFNPNVLVNLARLTDSLAGDIRDKVDVTLLGPASSTGLQNMVREVRAAPLASATQAALDGVSIVSALATASDAILLYESSPPTYNLQLPAPGVPFLKKIALPQPTISVDEQRTRTVLFPPLQFEGISAVWQPVPSDPPWREVLGPTSTVKELLEQSTRSGVANARSGACISSARSRATTWFCGNCSKNSNSGGGDRST